ncbi:7-cyano-7-deazaguanine reductase [Bacillus safensis FO-36b] [Bacillus safensis subsp. safensis]
MTTRKPEELEGVTLLGNQGTNYLFDYAPQVLETFLH